MASVDLDEALAEVIGGRTATALAKHIGVVSVRDLLHYYPRRWAERGQLTDLSRLRAGDDVTVMATVHSAKSIQMRSRRGAITEVVVTDGHGQLGLTFFNQRWREKELVPGRAGMFAGKVTEFRGRRKLNNPDYLLFNASTVADEAADEFAGSLIPVYPAVAALASWTISRSVKIVLDALPTIEDPLPAEIRAEQGLADLDTALRGIHRPSDRSALDAARRRLKWDEALNVQMVLAQRRHNTSINPAQPRVRRPGGLLAAFDARLPFALTAGQIAVGADIEADLDRHHPMHRLLQGEVGSGKTVVALRAMLQTIDAGGQAALLAPTEVLAAQHARSISALLGDLGVAGQFGAAENATRIALLTGSLSARARRQALLDAAGGSAGIVIGTHALIQKTVEFADLGLVVVDEQHRFGVEQRDALRAKSASPPHLLVMTATPIPRTVAMTVFGDLEVSALAELPSGRAPISTSVVPVAERPAWLDRVWTRVNEEVAQGRQAYIVCPSIDPRTPDGGAGSGPEDGVDDDRADDDLAADPEADDDAATPTPLHAVTELAEQLRTGPLADIRLDLLHGRMSGEEKDDVMVRFAAGEVDALVATTVIEVGVDVPNASVMVIMDADRFGVSQLHQLRGRVGRGGLPGLCLLVTELPEGAPARARLDAVAATTDGFELAQIDLEQRREGDVLGVSQAGRTSSLKLLSLLRDEDVIAAARASATALIAADPELAGAPRLAAQVAAFVDEERARYLDKA